MHSTLRARSSFNRRIPEGSPEPEQDALALALLPRYQLVRAIGSGAMGSVFLARDTLLHCMVAIKAIRPEYARMAEWRARFLREARLGAQLDHPGIVSVQDIVQSGAVIAIVMPYAGTSAGALVREHGALPEVEARAILIAAAEALAFVHGRGVVHRDVKPDNILISRERDTRRIRLSDFGIASLPHAGSESASAPAGSPAFMAPEQLLDHLDAGPRSDIYALGVVGYFLLTGALPFEGESIHAILARKLEEDYVPIRVRASKVSQGLAGAIERCLAAAPEARWPGARAFRAGLEVKTRSRGRKLREWLANLYSGSGPVAHEARA
ncbi:MAG TPA: serine/threonine-protein kinase [Gemmatimonadaceae bacterium]|nr:serine/threonine-protein kinase [Gemmatimonadaceae bacterium]